MFSNVTKDGSCRRKVGISTESNPAFYYLQPPIWKFGTDLSSSVDAATGVRLLGHNRRVQSACSWDSRNKHWGNVERRLLCMWLTQIQSLASHIIPIALPCNLWACQEWSKKTNTPKRTKYKHYTDTLFHCYLHRYYLNLASEQPMHTSFYKGVWDTLSTIRSVRQ